jgi:hypothetical protein
MDGYFAPVNPYSRLETSNLLSEMCKHTKIRSVSLENFNILNIKFKQLPAIELEWLGFDGSPFYLDLPIYYYENTHSWQIPNNNKFGTLNVFVDAVRKIALNKPVFKVTDLSIKTNEFYKDLADKIYEAMISEDLTSSHWSKLTGFQTVTINRFLRKEFSGLSVDQMLKMYHALNLPKLL